MAHLLYYEIAIKSTETLGNIPNILEKLGYIIDEDQPHLSNEGVLLMRDKRVLLGKDTLGKRVVIKLSNSPGGREEIIKEKLAQDTLSRAIFSQETIHFPEEVYYGEHEGYIIRVTKFIEQEQVFGAYPFEKQFFMIMREFEAQESFYANTFEHISIIERTFPTTHAKDYITQFGNFKIGEHKDAALKLLEENKDNIETRSNYLTHTDFVPSNFRISSDKIYMIDLSSIHFGNRYEGLARFLNYCTIHNPPLLKAITDYIKEDRGNEEYLSLRIMRIYKAGLLINHYHNILEKTDGDLTTLTHIRLDLWQNILQHLMEDRPVDPSLIEEYKAKRDKLRSPDELNRQKEFNLI
jgi:hypothetical protein